MVNRNGLLQHMLDGLELLALVRGAERNRDAVRPRPRRAANAVDVAFRLVRQFVVEDVRDARDINAARGDIGGDQHLELARAEALQGPLALALAAVAVDRIGADSLFAERLRQLVRPELGAGEHQPPQHLRFVQEGAEQVALQLLVHHHHALLDALDRGGLRSNLHAHRVVEQRLHQFRHALGHGRGEEHVLPRFRKQCGNALDLRQEAHVQHAVGLVQHQHLHVVQEDVALLQVIAQASGRGDQHLDPVLKHAPLRRQPHSAIHHPAGQAQVASELVDHGVHLNGQLTGRNKDQCAWTLAVGHVALGHQTVQHWQHKRRRLARARLRNAQQVVPVEQFRNGFVLNRGGGVEVQFAQCLMQRGRQRELLKGVHNTPNGW